ncbi:MAG: hypothetical protein HYY04_04625 [Chloroflexi bacterium]|nr:hypothetical protein [Chloroflexota bacterium]
MFDAHATISRMILLITLVVAVWALATAIGRRSLSPAFWSAFVVAEAILGVQAIIGILLLLLGRQPRDWLHLAYGLIAAAALPFANSYAARSPARAALILGLTALFTFGLGVRAITTG